MKRFVSHGATTWLPHVSCAAAIALAAALALVACKAPDGAESSRASNAAANGAPNANSQANASAQANAPQAAASPADRVRRISVADAREAAERGEAVFVDVRGKAEFERSLIKGAVSLPRNEAAARAGELPKGKLLITYCA